MLLYSISASAPDDVATVCTNGAKAVFESYIQVKLVTLTKITADSRVPMISSLSTYKAEPTPGEQVLAPESVPTDIDETPVENPYKALAEATPDDLANHSAEEDENFDVDDGAPTGFRFLNGTYFPHLKGHIVRDSVDSSSEYAKRVFFKDGCVVADPYMPEDNDTESDCSDHDPNPKGKKRSFDEMHHEQDEEDERYYDEESLAKFYEAAYRTKCGLYDQNAQCCCEVCGAGSDSDSGE